MRKATSIPREQLLTLGTCFGKFTKTGKFRLHITALEYLAPLAKHKVWVRPNGEMPLLYGNHVLKAHLGRMTEDTPEHQGVILYSMADVPLVCIAFVVLHCTLITDMACRASESRQSQQSTFER